MKTWHPSVAQSRQRPLQNHVKPDNLEKRIPQRQQQMVHGQSPGDRGLSLSHTHTHTNKKTRVSGKNCPIAERSDPSGFVSGGMEPFSQILQGTYSKPPHPVSMPGSCWKHELPGVWPDPSIVPDKTCRTQVDYRENSVCGKKKKHVAIHRDKIRLISVNKKGVWFTGKHISPVFSPICQCWSTNKAHIYILICSIDPICVLTHPTWSSICSWVHKTIKRAFQCLWGPKKMNV